MKAAAQPERLKLTGVPSGLGRLSSPDITPAPQKGGLIRELQLEAILCRRQNDRSLSGPSLRNNDAEL